MEYPGWDSPKHARLFLFDQFHVWFTIAEMCTRSLIIQVISTNFKTKNLYIKWFYIVSFYCISLCASNIIDFFLNTVIILILPKIVINLFICIYNFDKNIQIIYCTYITHFLCNYRLDSINAILWCRNIKPYLMYNSAVILYQIYIKDSTHTIIDQSEIITRTFNSGRQHSSEIRHKIVTSPVVYICMYIYRLARVSSRFGMQRHLPLMKRKLKMLSFCDNRSLDIKLVTLSVDFSTMSIC